MADGGHIVTPQTVTVGTMTPILMASDATLRDYFAAAALNRLLAWDFSGPEGSSLNFPHYAEQAAITAYRMADAMLAERDKK